MGLPVRLRMLSTIWSRNKSNTWESGLSPSDILADASGDIPIVWPSDEEDADIASVTWWVGTLGDYGSPELVPNRLAIFVHRDDEIIDGYHRMTAAMILGWKRFPVIKASR